MGLVEFEIAIIEGVVRDADLLQESEVTLCNESAFRESGFVARPPCH